MTPQPTNNTQDNNYNDSVDNSVYNTNVYKKSLSVDLDDTEVNKTNTQYLEDDELRDLISEALHWCTRMPCNRCRKSQSLLARLKARDEQREREAVRMFAVALHEAGGEIFVSKRSFEAINTDDVVNREDLPYGIRFYLTQSPKKKGSE